MFNDVFGSGRGPGVLGALLGLFVLAAFWGLAFVVMEHEEASEIPLSEKIDNRIATVSELDEELETQRSRLNMYRVLNDKNSKLNQLRDEVAEKKDVLSTKVLAHQNLQSDIEALYAEWGEYRELYRENERALWIGRKVDLSSTKGDYFKECFVTGITPTLFRVRTEAGALRAIKYTELPKDIQDRLQFGDEEASAYELQLQRIEKENFEKRKTMEKADQEKRAQREARDTEMQIEKVKRMIRQRTDEYRKKLTEAQKWRKKLSDLKNKSSRGKSGKRVILDGSISEYEVKVRATQRVVDSLKKKIEQLNAELKNLRRK